MNEVNQNLSENLGAFLMEFRDEIVNGIQKYLETNNRNTEGL